MTDAPELEQLARRYLDLWQDQVAAQVNDPAFAEALAKVYALTTKGAGLVATAAGLPVATPTNGAHDDQVAAGTAAPSAPARAAAAAVSSDDASDDLARLRRRVAELEERIGQLEAAVAAGRRRLEAATRRRRP